jgi:hypothetical protein
VTIKIKKWQFIGKRKTFFEKGEQKIAYKKLEGKSHAKNYTHKKYSLLIREIE